MRGRQVLRHGVVALEAVTAALVTIGQAVAAPAARAAAAAAPAPIVRGFAPAKGPTGTVVTVNGRYFTGATSVKVGATAALSFTVSDDRTLDVVVPAGASTGPISVITPSGTGIGPVFTIDDRTVRGFSPTVAVPGTVVVLNGFNFLGTTQVRFDGVASPAFTVVDDRTIYAEAPLGAGIGPITVIEGAATGTSLPFTFDPMTRIRGFTPVSGGPGTVVTINGQNFQDATGVDFGTTAAFSFTVTSNTQIRAVVPYGATLGQVVVHGVNNDATFGQVKFRAGGQAVSYPITAGVLGTGTGVVSSSPAGIDCPRTSCVQSYPFLTAVTLTATAAPGSLFSGWSGACSGTGACVVTMDAAKSVSATFTEITWALTVTRSGPGTVTSSPGGIFCGSACSASFDDGVSMTLTATPDPAATFLGWSGACAGTSSSCTVLMDAAHTVSATFAADQSLTVTKTGTGSGLVSSAPAGILCGSACAASYIYNTVVTLSATAASGSAFAGWPGACSGTGTCVLAVLGPLNVTATFTASQGGQLFPLTVVSKAGLVTSAPAGISCGATCVASFASGTSVVLTASPASGVLLTGWSGCDSITGGGMNCTVSMNAARSVTAQYSVPLSVARAGTGSGTVSSTPAGINCGATCSAVYAGGTLVTLTAAADLNSSFAGWTGACTGTSPCTVTMDQARSVTAVFNLSSVFLTVQRGGNSAGFVTSTPGGINCGTTCSAAYTSGTSVTLTAGGAAVLGWTGCDSTTATTCRVTLFGSKSVSVNFA
mgnify:CR=1 FL=1